MKYIRDIEQKCNKSTNNDKGLQGPTYLRSSVCAVKLLQKNGT